MDSTLRALAAKYRSSRDTSEPLHDRVTGLYKKCISRREGPLVDAAADAAAVGTLFLADQVDMSQVTPQMEEALRLAYPGETFASLADKNPEELGGFLQGLKGKYFEVLVRDDLNCGKWIGDIHLDSEQTAELAASATQPGWDLRIVDPDGNVASELQLKATESLGYVKEALERYPGIEVISTDDVLDRGHEALQSVIGSGYADGKLEDAVRAPLEQLLDGPLEEFAETVLPCLPFIIIAASEGRHVLLGRKSAELAIEDGLERGIKSTLSIGVGAIVVALDGGWLSVPASFLARLGFDRYRILRKINDRLDVKIKELRLLREAIVA